MNQEKEDFTEAQQDVLKSIRLSRIIIPVFLGIIAVAYLLWRQFDPEEFSKIQWTSHTLFWISITVGIIVVRH